jgi:succinoglycan biosynthesis protein ExoV
MHGAIVADALRIPWIPVCTREGINSFKWEDWCASVSLDYRPYHLPAIWAPTPRAGLVRRASRRVKFSIATRALRRLASQARPTLSREDVLEQRLCELESRLEQLRRKELPLHR